MTTDCSSVLGADMSVSSGTGCDVVSVIVNIFGGCAWCGWCAVGGVEVRGVGVLTAVGWRDVVAIEKAGDGLVCVELFSLFSPGEEVNHFVESVRKGAQRIVLCYIYGDCSCGVRAVSPVKRSTMSKRQPLLFSLSHGNSGCKLGLMHPWL